jgi:hypothetical protein
MKFDVSAEGGIAAGRMAIVRALIAATPPKPDPFFTLKFSNGARAYLPRGRWAECLCLWHSAGCILAESEGVFFVDLNPEQSDALRSGKGFLAARPTLTVMLVGDLLPWGRA